MDEYLEGVVIDVCSRQFMCLSNEGSKKYLECENYQEFMNVLKFINDILDPDKISYAEICMVE